jgi:pimeloyl-ACP methyl ester carboxylesterase
LLGDGAHLVGHSYGGVVAMLAAAMAPEKVLSLVLIEPAAHRAAEEHPAVADTIRGSKAFMDKARQRPSKEYLELVFGDLPRPEPAEYLERAAASALHERPAWLAEIPVEELAEGTYPKLVIAGAWDFTAPGYLPGMGDVIQQVGRTVAAKIGAEYREIPGAAHEAHKEQPDVVNHLLDDLWQRATGKMAG